MTKKDFKAIAQGFANARPAGGPSTQVYAAWFHAVAEVSVRLAKTNPRFSYDLFKSACETLPAYFA